MDTVRVGIIGFGSMGSGHAASIAEGKINGMKLCAICDVDPVQQEDAKKKYPDVAVFAEHTALLESGIVDAVIIATPHYYHPPIAIAAFEAGLHVLTEKPVGVYTKQVREMNEAAKKSGKVFSVMFNMRAMNAYKEVRELLRSGELGSIKRILWTATRWYRPQAYHNSSSWRSTWKEEGGGVLINQCPHNIDLWQWLFGMPEKVYAKINYGRYYDIEVEDDVTAHFTYKDGMHGSFITTTGETPGIDRLEISTDMGLLTVTDNTKITLLRNVVSEREFNRTVKKFFNTPKYWIANLPVSADKVTHNQILQNFTNAILYGEELIAPGESGINQVMLANAMHLSSWKNQDITLPFDEEEHYRLLMEKVANSKEKKASPRVVADLEGSFAHGAV